MSSNQASQEPFSKAASQWDLQRLYQDLATAKQKFAPHMRPELTDVEKENLRGLLCGCSPTEIAERRICSTGSVKVDLSNTIYRYVEVLMEQQRNALDNWRTVAVWLKDRGYSVQPDNAGGVQPLPIDPANPQILDWGEAPDVSVFLGRTDELAALTQWLLIDRCRLISVHGIWGIGKTTLAARLADRVKSEFDCLLWRSFLSPVSLDSVLTGWLQKLSSYLAIEVPSDTDGQISCLMQILENHRCLLVLDGLETLLQSGAYFSGHYHAEYRGYDNLLQRVGRTRHQSCLLLTSRENPSEVALLESDAVARSLRLNGLNPESAPELLRMKGLAQEEQWHRLVTIYRGNPLMLNIVSTSIQDLFGGDVDAFLQQSPTYVTRDLSRFLQQQLARLSPVEQQVMYKLAQVQEPLTLVELQESMHPISSCDVFEALEALIKRSLIERSTVKGFTLQPVIAEHLRRN